MLHAHMQGAKGKQHIGFRKDSLQSTGSGLIGTGRTSSGVHYCVAIETVVYVSGLHATAF